MLAIILIVSMLSLLLSSHVLCKKYRNGDTVTKADDALDTCTVETRSISRKARNMEELVTLLAVRTQQRSDQEREDA